MLNKICKKLTDNPNVADILSFPRFASATLPYNILDTLFHLDNSGIDFLMDESYLINSSPTKKTYMGLLETKGVSIFSKVSKVTKEKYEELVEDINDTINLQPDSLLFDVHWSIYKKSSKELFYKSPIVRKFLKLENGANKVDYGYEIKQANKSMVLPKNEYELSEYVAKELMVSGLLDTSCIGGEIGYVSEKNNRIKYSFFLNPLYAGNSGTAQDFARRLILVLMFLQKLSNNSSIGKNLLTKIIPLSPIPVIFSYKLSSGKIDKAFVFCDSHSSFINIEFNLQFCEDIYSKVCRIIDDSVKSNLDSLISDSTIKTSSIFQMLSNKWMFEIPNIYSTDADKFQSAINSLYEIFTEESFISRLKAEIVNSLGKVSGVDSILVESLINLFSKEESSNIFSAIASFAILSEQKYILMIPSVYRINGEQKSDNIITMFYDSQDKLKGDSQYLFRKIDHEVSKVDSFYGDSGLSRLLLLSPEQIREEFRRSLEIAQRNPHPSSSKLPPLEIIMRSIHDIDEYISYKALYLHSKDGISADNIRVDILEKHLLYAKIILDSPLKRDSSISLPISPGMIFIMGLINFIHDLNKDITKVNPIIYVDLKDGIKVILRIFLNKEEGENFYECISTGGGDSIFYFRQLITCDRSIFNGGKIAVDLSNISDSSTLRNNDETMLNKSSTEQIIENRISTKDWPHPFFIRPNRYKQALQYDFAKDYSYLELSWNNNLQVRSSSSSNF